MTAGAASAKCDRRPQEWAQRLSIGQGLVSLDCFVPHSTFEECSKRLKEHFMTKRKVGIIEVKMHACGGEAR